MFDAQPGQYSGLIKRYVVQQISALTSSTATERQPDNVDLRTRALAEVSDWSLQETRTSSGFLPRQSFLTSLGIRQLYGGFRQQDRAEWVESLLTNSRLLHSVTSAVTAALRDARTLAKVSVSGSRPLP